METSLCCICVKIIELTTILFGILDQGLNTMQSLWLKPVSHRRMHFRDWSLKEEILIKPISNHKKKSATSERAQAEMYERGLFLIVGCIFYIGHGKMKY